jgi:hypothetical protein
MLSFPSPNERRRLMPRESPIATILHLLAVIFYENECEAHPRENRFLTTGIGDAKPQSESGSMRINWKLVSSGFD